jgi:hypothetical protein
VAELLNGLGIKLSFIGAVPFLSDAFLFPLVLLIVAVLLRPVHLIGAVSDDQPAGHGEPGEGLHQCGADIIPCFEFIRGAKPRDGGRMSSDGATTNKNTPRSVTSATPTSAQSNTRGISFGRSSTIGPAWGSRTGRAPDSPPRRPPQNAGNLAQAARSRPTSTHRGIASRSAPVSLHMANGACNAQVGWSAPVKAPRRRMSLALPSRFLRAAGRKTGTTPAAYPAAGIAGVVPYRSCTAGATSAVAAAISGGAE